MSGLDEERQFVLSCSNFGRIKYWNGRVTYGTASLTGYRTVVVNKLTYTVHRLISVAFHGPLPTPYHTVDHINHKRDDNRSVNLRYATLSQQNTHAHTKPSRRHIAGSLGDKTIAVKEDGTKILFDSFTQASEHFGVSLTLLRARMAAAVPIDGFTISVEKQQLPEIDGEAWRPVDWIDECEWQVSNMGRCRRENGVIVSGTLNHGYLTVRIGRSQPCVHRLVARAFLGPPPAGTSVDHINMVKTDNRVTNLRYATRSEQIKGSYTNNPNRGRTGPRIPLLCRCVDGGGDWVQYDSCEECAKAVGTSRQSIRKMMNGELLSVNTATGNFEFKRAYAEIPGEVWRTIDIRQVKRGLEYE